MKLPGKKMWIDERYKNAEDRCYDISKSAGILLDQNQDTAASGVQICTDEELKEFAREIWAYATGMFDFGDNGNKMMHFEEYWKEIEK